VSKAKKTNADYCAAYRAREDAKAAKLDVLPVTFNLSKGIRTKLAAVRKATGMGADELINTLILAADAGTFSIPRTVIADDDKIFKHLTRNNYREASRDEN
jgi:hypothetical protein